MKYLTIKLPIKKTLLYLVENKFILVFHEGSDDTEFSSEIKAELLTNLTKFPLKMFLFAGIECFNERGYKFSPTYEINITIF